MTPTLRPPLAVALAAGLFLSVSTLTALQAQQPQGRGQQSPPAPTGPFAPEKYKDIQVLTDVPADQLDVTMRYFVAATGFQCQGCHVRDQATGEFAYEKNDVNRKGTARRMINLVKMVNAADLNIRINCGTCHGGQNRPAGLQLAAMLTPDQIAAMAARQGGAGPAGPGGAPPAPGGQRGAPGGAGAGAPGAPGPGGRGQQQPPPPPVDDIIVKYIDGLGGRAAVEKFHSLSIAGTVTNRAGQSMPFTIEEKEGKYRETVQSQPEATTRAFDGASGWTQTGATASDVTGFPLLQLVQRENLLLALKLKDKYPNLAAQRTARLPGAPGTQGPEVNILTGLMGPYTTDTLYFDAATGLLLRKTVRTTTALRGAITEQFDYSDYRVVNGIKVPHEIKFSNWNTLDTFKAKTIRVNAAIDDAHFARPH